MSRNKTNTKKNEELWAVCPCCDCPLTECETDGEIWYFCSLCDDAGNENWVFEEWEVGWAEPEEFQE